ncbi:phage integrase [Gilliamella apis]|uniref:Integrase n=1 Tax=Gilliamella apis TaxID=1970738 RepID=A0A242NXH8_9GAMM|nr:integrase [Gilliamella apis]OTQ35737.1 integrase [Gilliamella apis]OTQ39165.1 integrase [Gilliamella apis]OTQ41728.1 integrase [Gilliamella apis]OTQ44398.1 integrase [Gilliamella apis]
MTVRKQTNGKWLFEKYLEGGRRVRKIFATKGEALAYENYLEEQTNEKPWLGEKIDKRHLSDLINSWYSLHGQTLKDGQTRLKAMLFASECMDNPLANNFTAKQFTTYRQKRIEGEIYRTDRIKTVAPRTMNLELTYFKAMFNELIRLGEWQHKNPLELVRSFKTDEQEMAYLTKEQIQSLLNSCEQSSAKDLTIIVKICLATGARWSEAESLKSAQVKDGKITYINTKGKRNRTIPISEELFKQIPNKHGQLFTGCYSAFRSAIDRAGIELPDRQLTHVLRHTFASHFMMNGGNILVLQKILGHTDIKMTMRYAHFAPDHFEDAVRLNPLGY